MSNVARAYGLLIVWQFYRMRRDLVLMIVIQVALALGIVYGLSFLIPDIDPRAAAYLATGAPTVSLLIFGLSSGPQEISQEKLSGRHAYLSALPVPRLAIPAARLTFWLAAQIPGTLLAVFVSALRFDFALKISLAVVPAIVLVAVTGASVGYALGEVLRPEPAREAGSFLSILVLLFSPINFPMERLPEVLQSIHVVLPIKYMADVVRWSLTGRFAENVALAFLVVTIWCLSGIAVSWRAALRRP